MLTETGLLPGALMRNAGLKFVCRDVHLKVERTDTAFANRYHQGEVIRIPSPTMTATISPTRIRSSALKTKTGSPCAIAMRPARQRRKVTPTAPQRNIAGIYNAAGNVLGMMPHPERMIEPELTGTDGRGFFESLVEALN